MCTRTFHQVGVPTTVGCPMTTPCVPGCTVGTCTIVADRTQTIVNDTTTPKTQAVTVQSTTSHKACVAKVTIRGTVAPSNCDDTDSSDTDTDDEDDNDGDEATNKDKASSRRHHHHHHNKKGGGNGEGDKKCQATEKADAKDAPKAADSSSRRRNDDDDDETTVGALVLVHQRKGDNLQQIGFTNGGNIYPAQQQVVWSHPFVFTDDDHILTINETLPQAEAGSINPSNGDRLVLLYAHDSGKRVGNVSRRRRRRRGGAAQVHVVVETWVQ